MLEWSSKKAVRVIKSTLGCEAVAQTAAVEAAIKIAGWLHELDSAYVVTKKELRDRSSSGGFCYPVDV